MCCMQTVLPHLLTFRSPTAQNHIAATFRLLPWLLTTLWELADAVAAAVTAAVAPKSAPSLAY